MKRTIMLSMLIVSIAISAQLFAQNPGIVEEEHGGEYLPGRNDAVHPCISAEQYAAIEKDIARNIKMLHLDKGERKTTATLFSWPLQAASGLSDCGYYYIGNYVDEDPTSPAIKDYNCGSVTYDGHRGTDICTGPYPFLKMDNNQVNVIAAAPGTIIQKYDGYFDKNCAMNSDTANSLIIQHGDGSVALYWHMKKNSLTTKIVGQTVAAGEFLGVVGSSGSSTAPHLHFEVWSTTLSASIKDPWAGTCNALGGVTWWAAQKPYTEPALLHAQVNKILVVLPACPATESPNADSCFDPGATAKFYFFLRNETPGDTVFERIINPGGTTFTSWTHNCTTSYLASYWYFNKVLPTTPGIYTYETKYRGITCNSTFMINCAVLGTATVNNFQQTTVYPNPADNMLNIEVSDAENGRYQITLRNIVGQIVLSDKTDIVNNTFQKNYSTSMLADGVYFLNLESDNSRIVKKIVIQH
jgi:murein DD-endopeptidase MepM/ murein hydrolase activator NlpD